MADVASIYGAPAGGPIHSFNTEAGYQQAVEAGYADLWVLLPAETADGTPPRVGCFLNADGEWENAPLGPPPESALVDDIPTFFNRFTPDEEIAIEALRDGNPSADPPVPANPYVKLFYSRIDKAGRVNRAWPSVQGGVEYLAGQIAIGAGGKLANPPLTAQRAAQILAPDPY